MLQDVRYAVRTVLREPGFALTAILTLALGIGATTAIFSVVNAVILQPLPFDEPDRIVAINNYWTRTGARGRNVSAPDFHDWRAQSRSFEVMGYYTGAERSVTIGGVADYALGFAVTPGFLQALRARPALGRLLTDGEQRPGGPLAIVVTDGFWRRHFNGDAHVLGTTVKYDDRIFTIVGVLQPQTRYPARADFYYPAWVHPETPSRSGHNYRAIGRLRDGVTLEQARAEMTAIATRLEQLYPQSNEGKLVALVPLHELVVGSTRRTFYVLLGAVGLVLLIACANVANLLLARAANRQREMVVRAALGAGRARLVRQLLTESAVLGVAAALAGAWLARLGVDALVALAPAGLPRIDEVQVDAAALAFALGTALVASVLFGLAPAVHVSRVRLAEGLRQGGKGSSIGAARGWARSAFVIAEVALAVVLVAGAGLLGRSLAALTSVDMGLDPERVLVLRTAVPVATRAEAPRATAFYRDLLADLRATPGIDAAAGVTSLPTQVRSNGGYVIEGGPPAASVGRMPQAVFNVITPEYFRTLRVPVRRGRDFSAADTLDAPLVAIINEALAREAFGDADPIGRRIQCGLDTLEFMTIVGVAADVRTAGPASPASPEIYMPYEQHPGPATALNIVARTHTRDPLALVDTVRRKIGALNPDVPVKATTMEGTLETASETPRFRTVLLGVFAAAALLLALGGVYSVLAYTVAQRVPELGVRIALGATRENIMGLVIGQAARLAGAGLVLGVALALLSGRALEGLLFAVTPRDPAVLVTVTALVAVATLAACYIPVRRAVRVDPMVALRSE